MNTQLETEPSVERRMAQLDWCLANMELLNNDTTAILAGDMNIYKESELSSLGRELCSTGEKTQSSKRVAFRYWQVKLIKRSVQEFLKNTFEWINDSNT